MENTSSDIVSWIINCMHRKLRHYISTNSGEGGYIKQNLNIKSSPRWNCTVTRPYFRLLGSAALCCASAIPFTFNWNYIPRIVQSSFCGASRQIYIIDRIIINSHQDAFVSLFRVYYPSDEDIWWKVNWIIYFNQIMRGGVYHLLLCGPSNHWRPFLFPGSFKKIKKKPPGKKTNVSVKNLKMRKWIKSSVKSIYADTLQLIRIASGSNLCTRSIGGEFPEFRRLVCVSCR